MAIIFNLALTNLKTNKVALIDEDSGISVLCELSDIERIENSVMEREYSLIYIKDLIDEDTIRRYNIEHRLAKELILKMFR